jgi:hypothetical protein
MNTNTESTETQNISTADNASEVATDIAAVQIASATSEVTGQQPLLEVQGLRKVF